MMFDPHNEMQQLNNNVHGENPWEFMDVELNKPFDQNAENGGYKACLSCCGGCQVKC